MRFLGVALIAAYVYVAFVPPTGMSLEGLKAQAISGAISTLQELLSGAEEKVSAVFQESVQRIPRTDVRELLRFIEDGRIQDDVYACGSLPALSSYENVPSIGDWIAYCLARIRRDPRRCTQIAATLTPDLRSLCERELNS
jgi:hypothetical protein